MRLFTPWRRFLSSLESVPPTDVMALTVLKRPRPLRMRCRRRCLTVVGALLVRVAFVNTICAAARSCYRQVADRLPSADDAAERPVCVGSIATVCCRGQRDVRGNVRLFQPRRGRPAPISWCRRRAEGLATVWEPRSASRECAAVLERRSQVPTPLRGDLVTPYVHDEVAWSKCRHPPSRSVPPPVLVQADVAGPC